MLHDSRCRCVGSTFALIGWVAAAGWLAPAAPCLAQQAAKVEAREIMPTGSSDNHLLKSVISPDGMHVGSITSQGSRFVVMHDGKPGPRYDGIVGQGNYGARGLTALVFSPDSKRLAYIATKGNETRVIVDDKEVFTVPEGKTVLPSGPENEPGPMVLFSPDSSRYAFSTWDLAVIDGKPGVQYQRVSGLCFSPDSKHVAYIGQDAEGKLRVVLDGKEEPAYVEIRHLQFSPDSRLAYVGLEPDMANAKSGQPAPSIHHVMLGGKELGSYASITPILFNQDGTHYAFTATKPADKQPDGTERWYVVHDGKDTPCVPVTQYGQPLPTLRISADGTRVAYIEQGKNGQFVTVNGESGDIYSRIETLEFSPKGKRYWYSALQMGTTSGHRTDNSFLVVDGKEVAEGGRGPVVFSPDESRYATIVGAGPNQAAVIVDGERQKPYAAIDALQFSPDGKRVGYFAANIRRSDQFIVIDDKEMPYQAVVKESLAFSPDGKHFAFGASAPMQQPSLVRACLVVDGREGWLADGSRISPEPIRFSDDGRHAVHVQMARLPGANVHQVMINGKAIEGYPPLMERGQQLSHPIAFSPDGSVRYLSIKDGVLYAVTATPAAGDSHASLPTATPDAAPNQGIGQSHSQQQQQAQQQHVQEQRKKQQQQQEEQKRKREESRAEEAARRAEDAVKAAKGLEGLFKKRRQ